MAEHLVDSTPQARRVHTAMKAMLQQVTEATLAWNGALNQATSMQALEQKKGLLPEGTELNLNYSVDLKLSATGYMFLIIAEGAGVLLFRQK